MDEEKQRELQQKYMEMQGLQQQMNQFQEQLQSMDQQLVEFQAVKDSLDDFAKVKVGSSALVQLHPGIFARAKIENNKKLQVNVGSEVNVEKTIPETKKIIDKQIKVVEKNRGELMKHLQKIAMQAQQIEAELTRLVK